MSGLTTLPAEILGEIYLRVREPRDLINLLRCSRRLHQAWLGQKEYISRSLLLDPRNFYFTFYPSHHPPPVVIPLHRDAVLRLCKGTSNVSAHAKDAGRQFAALRRLYHVRRVILTSVTRLELLILRFNPVDGNSLSCHDRLHRLKLERLVGLLVELWYGYHVGGEELVEQLGKENPDLEALDEVIAVDGRGWDGIPVKRTRAAGNSEEAKARLWLHFAELIVKMSPWRTYECSAASWTVQRREDDELAVDSLAEYPGM